MCLLINVQLPWDRPRYLLDDHRLTKFHDRHSPNLNYSLLLLPQPSSICFSPVLSWPEPQAFISCSCWSAVELAVSPWCSSYTFFCLLSFFPLFCPFLSTLSSLPPSVFLLSPATWMLSISVPLHNVFINISYLTSIAIQNEQYSFYLSVLIWNWKYPGNTQAFLSPFSLLIVSSSF